MCKQTFCSAWYKEGTIKALIHRAYKVSSTWQHFNNSIHKIKQALINNGYANYLFDRILKQYLNRRKEIENRNQGTRHESDTVGDREPIRVVGSEHVEDQRRVEGGGVDGATVRHDVYYCNQYSSAHKTDERILRQIIRNNVQCTENNHRLNLVIFYQSNTIKQLVSKNNSTPKQPDLKQSNVVYEFKCPHGECALQQNSYIGMTTTSLSRRLTMHLAGGGSKSHYETAHNTKLTRANIVANTTILRKENNIHKLQILEAIFILQKKPTINTQVAYSHRTLKLHNQ